MEGNGKDMKWKEVNGHVRKWKNSKRGWKAEHLIDYRFPNLFSTSCSMHIKCPFWESKSLTPWWRMITNHTAVTGRHVSRSRFPDFSVHERRSRPGSVGPGNGEDRWKSPDYQISKQFRIPVFWRGMICSKVCVCVWYASCTSKHEIRWCP